MRPFFVFAILTDMPACISRLRAHLLFLIVLVSTAAAYWPGLHGGFLFDDFANLPTLGQSGPVDNWPAFWRYITSGTADPTGRPLTVLTFLLNAHDWPANPFWFKCTNLALHLTNGVLLYVLLLRLGTCLTTNKERNRTAALVGTALWILHPLLVSTTLYVVQREAILPATFVLIGLLSWLHGRTLLAARPRRGALYCFLGLGICSVFAVMAKANGALLPMYALLIERLLLSKHEPLPNEASRRVYRKIMLWLAIVPSLAILTYLFYVGVHGIAQGGNAPTRPWSYAQRLLTEPRVLLDYLALLWMPRPFSSGLFNDQVLASASLWSPATTLPSILVILSLIVGAWTLRHRFPMPALAILFYFAGHLIESTSISLELYYEHRNYIPAMLMFWPLAFWLASNGSLSRLKYAMAFILPLLLAWMTYQNAQVWGNESQQALMWAYLNPESPRAQAGAAQTEMQLGQPRKAVARLEKALAAHPNEPQLAINMIGARCMLGGISSRDIEIAQHSLQNATTLGTLLTHWFDRVLPVAATGKCSGFTLDTLQTLVVAAAQNPLLNKNGQQQDFLYLEGRIELARRNAEAALADFTKALDLEIRPGIALEEAANLGNAGYPAQGLCLLDHYRAIETNSTPPAFGMPMIHAWVLRQQHYWPNEITHLRSSLTDDASAKYAAKSSSNWCDLSATP
jgi:tetratricopeptide (TPR) repeat protein